MNQTQAVCSIGPATEAVAVYPQVAANSLYNEASEVYAACWKINQHNWHNACFLLPCPLPRKNSHFAARTLNCTILKFARHRMLIFRKRELYSGRHRGRSGF